MLLLIVSAFFGLLQTAAALQTNWIMSNGPAKQFTPIVGGTPFLLCASCAETIALPFTLQFGSYSTTSIVVSSNGVVSLEGNVSSLPTNWDAKLSISDNTTLFPRVAVIQAHLGGNNVRV